MTSKQTLQERSFINFLVAVKCKPWEMCRIMCDVYGEVGFSENIYKLAKYEFFTSSMSQKGSPWNGNILTLR